MTLLRTRSIALLAALAIGAISGPATAQPEMSRALSRAAFEEGMKLFKAGSYPSACARLEESLRLDAQMGTRFWLADCYEHLGKTASAWSNFLAVASEAEATGHATRAATARKRADALQASLSKLVVTVAAEARGTPGLEIRRDDTVLGSILWGTPLPVDPGPHKLRASAPGREPWEVTLDLASSGGRVEVPLLREARVAPLAAPPPIATSPPPAPPATVEVDRRAPLPSPTPPRDSWRRGTVVVAGSVGLGGVVVGSLFGGLSLSTWHSAQALCTPRCSAAAPAQGATATTYATASDIGFALAGAGLGTALVVWLTPPAGALSGRATALHFGLTPGGLVLGGTFQ